MSLTTKGHFSVGGVEYSPQQLRLTYESLADENSGRVQSGQMKISWIKSKLRKWEITMPPMQQAEATALLNAVQGQIYNITIYDITGEQTVQVYTSNVTADLYSGVICNGLWTGIKFSAIEVG